MFLTLYISLSSSSGFQIKMKISFKRPCRYHALQPEIFSKDLAGEEGLVSCACFQDAVNVCARADEQDSTL